MVGALTRIRDSAFPVLLTAALLVLTGCGNEPAEGRSLEATPSGRAVDTSGKQGTALDAVPEAVLQAARAARPGLAIAEAEHEVRDGRAYYDLAGTLADGSELELDLTQIEGAWTVVEVQRDVALPDVPAPAREALPEASEGWLPTRIIESDQGDGVVIYEFFGTAAGGGEKKLEVKWDDGTAELLRDEWKH